MPERKIAYGRIPPPDHPAGANMNPILGWTFTASLIVFATWVTVGLIIFQWGMRPRFVFGGYAVALGALALAVVVMP